MIAREPPPQRTPEDFRDAARLRAAGYDIADVASWTFLSRRQVRSVDPAGKDPLPGPAEIAERAAEVRSTWSADERCRRRWDIDGPWTIPQDVPVVADEQDSED